jgi:hypothetical protein
MDQSVKAPSVDRRAYPRTVVAVMLKKLRPYFLVALTLVGVLAAVVPGTGRASAERTEDVEFSELTVPSTLSIPVRVSAAEVTLVDLFNNKEISLRGVTPGDQSTDLAIPQLPVGSFELTWPGGSRLIEVKSEASSPWGYPGQTSGPAVPVMPFVILGVGVVCAGLALRKNRRLALVVCLGALSIGGALLARAAPPSDGTIGARVLNWEQCAATAGNASYLQAQANLRDCRAHYFISILETKDFTRMADVLKKTTESSCHTVAHLAGFSFYRAYPVPDTLLDSLVPGCTDGMIHGMMEAMSLYYEETEYAVNIDQICSGIDDVSKARSCYHGVGHSMLWRTNGNLDAAWRLCEVVPDRRSPGPEKAFTRIPLTENEFSSRLECKSASTMEWADRWGVERETSAERTLLPELEEPMDICKRGPSGELFQVGCYLGTNYRTLNPSEAARRCNDVASFPISCFAVLGDNVVHFTRISQGVAPTPEIIAGHAAVCRQALDPAAQYACTQSVARQFSYVVSSATLGSAVCVLLPTQQQPACRAGVEETRVSYAARGLELS